MYARILQAAVRALDAVADRFPWSKDTRPGHIRTGERGEEDAYFWLRQCGYIVVARGWRSAHARGDLDLVAYQGATLCFIEVKSRTTRDIAPPEVAVDRDKQRQLRILARDYLRRAVRAGKGQPSYRFDIVSIYYDGANPTFELFQNAF